MHRIDSSGATETNQFTEGDPSSGVPATQVTDDWLNAVQEELCGAIEGVGLALDKGDNAQLVTALQALAAAAASWTTGDAKLTLKTAPDSGWIMADDGTIGDASSGASNRANADTESLYTLLWTNLPDAVAPVTGGRGASAAEDFAAHKPIQVGTIVGRALAVAGAGSGLTARALGEILGEETHQLTIEEGPEHKHTIPWGEDMWTPPWGKNTNYTNQSGASGIDSDNEWAYSEPVGGDQPHNNMQPTTFLNVMIKL